jgi:hypothetical protein
MLYVVSIFVIMNLEKRFHLFQDFLIEMSNGAITYVRSINLKKLDKPTLRYVTGRTTVYRDTFHYEDLDMRVHVTEYIFTIDVVAKCHIDEVWCNELINMFRGTFSGLIPEKCKIDIIPLTNEPTSRNWFA